MHNVVIRAMLLEVRINPFPKGKRLRETARTDIQKFIHVQRICQISYLFRPKKVIRMIKVKTRHFYQADILIQMGVWGAGDYIDPMSLIGQCLA